ncbi:MAG: hypothetical protein ACFBSC_02545 [Microcoleaceae cyanobacterium]
MHARKFRKATNRNYGRGRQYSNNRQNQEQEQKEEGSNNSDTGAADS